MFEVGQRVIHYRVGLSTISGVTKMGEKDYFVLHALDNQSDSIFVSTEKTENIIRNIMTSKEADALLKFIKQIKLEIITNTKQRRDQYKKRLSSGNVEDIAYLFKQLFFYHLYLNTENEYKLGPNDLEMMEFAKKILLDELALSYDKDRNEIEKYLIKKIA